MCVCVCVCVCVCEQALFQEPNCIIITLIKILSIIQIVRRKYSIIFIKMITLLYTHR